MPHFYQFIDLNMYDGVIPYFYLIFNFKHFLLCDALLLAVYWLRSFVVVWCLILIDFLFVTISYGVMPYLFQFVDHENFLWCFPYFYQFIVCEHFLWCEDLLFGFIDFLLCDTFFYCFYDCEHFLLFSSDWSWTFLMVWGLTFMGLGKRVFKFWCCQA